MEKYGEFDPKETIVVQKKSRFTDTAEEEGKMIDVVMNEAEYRKEKLNDYASQMKLKMRDQFRGSFVNSGTMK